MDNPGGLGKPDPESLPESGATPGAPDWVQSAPLNAMGKTFLTLPLNNTPTQSRAEDTLSRLLDRAEGIARRHGEPGVTLKGLAEAANVSLTSVYRYFSSPEQVIRMIVRRMLIRRFDRVSAAMNQSRYETPEVLADYIVQMIGAHFLTDNAITRFGKNGRVQKYFDIAYAELNDLAVDIEAKLRRCDIAPECGYLQASLAASLAAIGAAGRMGYYHHPNYLRDGGFEAFAYRLLLSTMRGEC